MTDSLPLKTQALLDTLVGGQNHKKHLCSLFWDLVYSDVLCERKKTTVNIQKILSLKDPHRMPIILNFSTLTLHSFTSTITVRRFTYVLLAESCCRTPNVHSEQSTKLPPSLCPPSLFLSLIPSILLFTLAQVGCCSMLWCKTCESHLRLTGCPDNLWRLTSLCPTHTRYTHTHT